MNIRDKLKLYGFTGDRRRNAYLTLKLAERQGKDIDRLQLVCEPNDRVSYVERK